MNLSGVFDDNGNYKFNDFWEFLKVYEAATAVLQTPQDFYRLTRAVLEESAANGVIYSEMFLSPDFCGGRDLSAWRDYLAAIRSAADDAEAADGIVTRGIVTAVRHEGPDASKETARCATETADDWLTGFGLGGDEAVLSQARFFLGLRCRARSGFAPDPPMLANGGGPESVRDALDHLRV